MNTKVTLAGVELKNPVMTCSGTFGSGMEYGEMIDLDRLGAVVTKGIANVPWPGNPTPRVTEVYGGMLNAIGLQGPGVDVFMKRDVPFLRQHDTKIIVNVCGKSESDYVDVVERLADADVDMLEINISCPNVKEGGIAFGQDPKCAEQITKAVKKVAKQPVIMKLSPNVTDIAEMARAVEAGGADVVSLINTITGMKIDINKRTFALANKTGGMSGPAIKPVAVRMVYQVANAVKIPVIAAGGIADGRGIAAAFMLGAEAVQMGTRFVATEECNVHENYKQFLLKARDIDTRVTGRTTGHPVRTLRNPMTKEYLEKEAAGASFEELEMLTLGGLRKAVVDGDVKTGSVMSGQIAGMVKDVPACKDLMARLMAETKEAVKKNSFLVEE